MEIPDDLLCLFSGRVERRDGSVVIDVPADELDHGDIAVGNVYRVALLSGVDGSDGDRTQSREPEREPPVQEGDVRTVEIEGIGDQGDGIAKVDRGYVVIVPGTDVGDEVTVEIESIYPNFAMGHVLEPEDGADPGEAEEPDPDSVAEAEEEPSEEATAEPEAEEAADAEPESGLDFGDTETEF